MRFVIVTGVSGAGKGVDDELLSVIELISIILGGLKGEDANGE